MDLAAARDSDLFLTPGVDAIVYDGKVMVCQARVDVPRGYAFAERSDGVMLPLSNERIWKLHADGTIRFMTSSETALPEALRGVLGRTLGAFNARERANIERRVKYMDAIDDVPDLAKSQAAWQPVCDAVTAANGFQKVNWFTCYRWHLNYVKANRDPRVLSGLDREKGNSNRKLPPLQVEALEASLHTFLRRDRPRYSTAKDAVNNFITRRVGREKVADGTVALVGYGAVRDHLKKLRREVTFHYRNGADATRQLITPVYSNPPVTLPFQRVEADFKYLRTFVVDEVSGFPLGTPFVTAAVDCYSGAVAGFDVSFDNPSSASASRCLRHVVQPKTKDGFLKDEYGECVVRGEWPINGVPQQFVLDNDQAFHAKHFQAAAKTLGCDVKFLEPGEAQGKGTIETLWRSLQVSYVDMFPGNVLRLTSKPGSDYKPEEDARITLGELRTFLAKAFVDVHNNATKDEKSGKIRLQRWLDGIAVHPPRPVRSHEDLLELVGCVEVRTIRRTGIHLFGLRYNSDVLADFSAGFETEPKVEVRYDADDLGRIFVLDPRGGRSFSVPTIWPEYARGLSLHRHRVIKRQAIDRGAKGKIYLRDLNLAKAELHELGRTMLSGKGTSRRIKQRIARYFGIAPDVVERMRDAPHDPDRSRGRNVSEPGGTDVDDEEILDEEERSDNLTIQREAVARGRGMKGRISRGKGAKATVCEGTTGEGSGGAAMVVEDSGGEGLDAGANGGQGEDRAAASEEDGVGDAPARAPAERAPTRLGDADSRTIPADEARPVTPAPVQERFANDEGVISAKPKRKIIYVTR